MYALIQNDVIVEFPYSVAGFRKKHKEISFPSIMTDEIYEQFGIFKVHGIDFTPSYDRLTQKVIAHEPELVDGVWTSSYEVVELDAETLAKIQELLVQRNASALQERLRKIQVARRAWLDEQIDPDGIALALLLYTSGNQKGVDIQSWLVALTDESDKRQAELEAGMCDWSESLLDFSMFPKPYSIRELRSEI